MARARDIIHAVLVAILFSINAPSQNLFLRSDLHSPEPIVPVVISDALVDRTFQIPTELIARRVHVPTFDRLDDLVTLENALRRELADHHVQIPSSSTNIADKDLRIGPPSTLFVRATRQDLAKMDLLLAAWMQTVQFQIEITSVELAPAAGVAILEKLSADIIPFDSPRSSDTVVRPSYLADESRRRDRFDRPIATSRLSEHQKDVLLRTLADSHVPAKTAMISAYAGERFDLRRPNPESFRPPITVRPTLNGDNSNTDLTFESRRTQFVTSSYEPDVVFTTSRGWILPGFQTITTTFDTSVESTQTISPKTSLLVISSATAETQLPPPNNSQTILFHIITSHPIFSE